MCLICSDLAKGKLTSKEARKNLEELIDDMTGEHYFEVLGSIEDKEKEERGDE